MPLDEYDSQTQNTKKIRIKTLIVCWPLDEKILHQNRVICLAVYNIDVTVHTSSLLFLISIIAYAIFWMLIDAEAICARTFNMNSNYMTYNICTG